MSVCTVAAVQLYSLRLCALSTANTVPPSGPDSLATAGRHSESHEHITALHDPHTHAAGTLMRFEQMLAAAVGQLAAAPASA